MRVTGGGDLEPLSVFLDEGVVPRSSRDDNHNRLGADLEGYLVVEPGDIVFNKLRTWQGGLGVSAHHGIVSPAYFVCRPQTGVVPRFLHYLLRSQVYLAELTRLSKWMPPAQFDIGWEELRALPVHLPPPPQQQAIVDYLDVETEGIDKAIQLRRQSVALLEEREVSLAHHTITGRDIEGDRTATSLEWLGDIPATWCLKPIGSQFQVQLGRMLNAERATTGDLRPYVRNINVRWDHVDTVDLAEMDFPAAERRQYALRAGDLLINEGGAGIGRAALWEGQLDECYFQKSVLRLRSLGESEPRWMIECMRVAVATKVFLVEGNLATIPHVPAEALRAHRFPFPDRSVQVSLMETLYRRRESDRRRRRALERQVELLREHRQALITATVTGQIHVTKAVA